VHKRKKEKMYTVLVLLMCGLLINLSFAQNDAYNMEDWPTCYSMSPKLCFSVSKDRNNTSQWNTEMQFLYGDVEPDNEIPPGYSEGDEFCMDVKTTKVCFSEPLIVNTLNETQTWMMSSGLHFTMPRAWWVLDPNRPKIYAVVKPKLCFATTQDNTAIHQWSSRVHMLLGNVVPNLRHPGKRVKNICMNVYETKACFSEQPLMDQTFVNKVWELNNLYFYVL
jgi:hypothetical protein